MLICSCCKSSDFEKPFDYINHHYSFLKNTSNDIFSDLKISVCSRCGFGFVNSIIPDRDLTNFYNHFYSHIDGVHPAWMRVNLNTWENAVDLRSLTQIFLAKQYVEIDNTSNVLDAGPGYGDLFATMKHFGDTSSFFAIEADLSKQKTLEKLGVKSFKSFKDLENVALEENFDLIVMSHSLEHFQHHNLEEILKTIHSVLSKKGVFLIEVPSDNYMVDEKEVNQCPHLCFFTVDSLKTLLTRIGFIVCFISELGGPKRAVQSTDKTKSSLLRKKMKNMRWIRLPVRFVKEQYYNAKKIIRLLLRPNIKNIFSSNEFVYGENLSCIRVVLKK